MRTDKKWNGLFLMVVLSLSLELFNIQLDKALSNLI